jgi:serine/threonine protein kinase
VVRQLGKGGMGTAYCVRRNDGGGSGGFSALKKVACRNVAEGNAALGEAKTLQLIYVCTYTRTHTHTHTHTHTQGLSHRNVVLSLSLSLSLSVCVRARVCLYNCRNVVRYHDVYTYIIIQTNTQTTHTLSLSHTHTQGLSHRNVVRYHDVFLHSDDGLMNVCTVMEFCRSGDLAAYLMQLKAGEAPV